MTNPQIKLDGIQIGTRSKNANAPMQSQPLPFLTLILANLCGHHHNCKPAPIQIDRDNFDVVLEAICPTLQISLDSTYAPLSITFTALQDFEPDALFNRLPVFAELKSLRRQLLNPATFHAAAATLGAFDRPTKAEPDYADSDAIELLLSTTRQRQQTENTQDLAQNLIRDIVAPYIIPATNPQLTQLLAAVDQSIGDLMKRILHHREFKALEATWRGIYFLVRQTETSSELKLFIFHCPKSSLLEDLSLNEITQTMLYKNAFANVSGIPGAIPWSLIIADYQFDTNEIDVLLADVLCQIAASNNACILGQASSRFVNCNDLAITPDSDDWQTPNSNEFEFAWTELRQKSYARHLGLCFPHFLLRLPYGKNTHPVEQFAWEEMAKVQHENFLWGNSAYAAAVLLAKTFSQSGWHFKPGQLNEIAGMLVFTYRDDYGDTLMQPAAEVYLTEKAGELIIDKGLIPIWSVANSDQIRLGPFMSVCVDDSLIRGNWS